MPYWWNKEIGSLQATIHRARPDLMSDPSQDPIPLENSLSMPKVLPYKGIIFKVAQLVAEISLRN